VYLIIAKKVGKFVASFPYVRAVFVSGSLSKGYMDEKSDIDFFIVTEPSRLWLSRTLLILFKKVFLFNSHKYLCPNYFIDSNSLEIEEKNLFTAKELSYLYPVYNQSLFEEMISHNAWTKTYMPNFTIKKEGSPERKKFLKNSLEFIFNFKVGDWLDSFCMKITENYWKNKYKAKYGIESTIRCAKHVSKYHPQGYQNKVIAAFSEKLKEFEVIKRIKLS
jgi:predicted nucleotidyltransferase